MKQNQTEIRLLLLPSRCVVFVPGHRCLCVETDVLNEGRRVSQI